MYKIDETSVEILLRYTTVKNTRLQKKKEGGASAERDCWSPLFLLRFGFKSAAACYFFTHYAPLSACVIARDIT